MVSIDRVSDGPAQLGECPVWSTAEQVLYWADIEGRQIHRFDPIDDETTTRHLPGRPGSFVLMPDPGRLLVAMEDELVEFDWLSGDSSGWLRLDTGASGNRLNDGRCDPSGRYVVGSMATDYRTGGTSGVLHQVEPSGSTRVLRTGIGVTNGLAFDENLSRMYFADSPTGTIIVWDYDVASGERSNERAFFEYGDLPGKPDGGCVDADGCYWSACVGGSSLIRITPDGRLDERIELPVARPSMPAFGGRDLTTIYVTSIATKTSAEASGRVPDGSLVALEAGVEGRPEPSFGGRIPG